MKIPSTAAVSLLLTVGTSARSIIHSGQGFGTYYYDIEQIDSCVAMNNTQLGADPSMYCGRRVVVSVNGQQSDLQLFIGDGCQRCGLGSSVSDIWNAEGAPGVDFSYTVLDKLSGGNACNAGHLAISWEIIDERIYDFDGSSSGFVSLSEPKSSYTAAGEPLVQCPAQSETRTTMTVGTSATQATVYSTACSEDAWQCNGAVLEQCIGSIWNPRITCTAGSDCQGGSNPYCI
ncbi:hypothetical protein N7499_004101 [Penicillium canescens]|uniref:Uncharacterized protein n=1 Tax=Penicillium canescens TaxID=5083 RepID=A0AAD6I8F7_PENCN|nr:hypothetical protein N7460_007688 [Penicillium canescens]KAJ6088850.1 hypothetical protein N7499_004101 [Penicillium canescens]